MFDKLLTMPRPKNTNGTINKRATSSRSLYIYGENYKYLLQKQGEFEKKTVKMGLGRIIDIIVTASRAKGEIPPFSDIIEDEVKGSCVYTAEGENLSHIIDIKNHYKGKPNIKYFGIAQVINMIITNARKK